MKSARNYDSKGPDSQPIADVRLASPDENNSVDGPATASLVFKFRELVRRNRSIRL